MTEIDRRQFTGRLAAGAVVAAIGRQSIADGPDELIEDRDVGPVVGHVSDSEANVWFRPRKAGRYTLTVYETESRHPLQSIADATVSNDLCIKWSNHHLKPATRYKYRISLDDQVISEGDENYFDTAPAVDHPSKVCLAIGSCADTKPLALWTQMREKGAQGLVLLGDTPYIDSINLSVARQKHRDFLAIPQLAQIARHTPVWGTWDDHDFGKNDSDGRLEGKGNSRRAFIEYRANSSFGEDGQGIYTKFRFGPLEVFLLDTRWFARTEPSPVDPAQLTLVGRRQWDWLLDGLRRSSAPFKVVACGMIWDDKENRESDDWGSYTHERSALFDFLGRESIEGVVLIGGDIHCSRALRYDTKQQVGYDIHQFITSPIHNRTIEALNVPHPSLLYGEAVPHVWLRLEADSTIDPPQLLAKWEQLDGQDMWSISLTSHDLRRA
jgi:alkaline phosphatase D